MGKRVLICGARDWVDRDLILDTMFKELPKGAVIIEGGAFGADRAAREAAVYLSLAFASRIGFPNPFTVETYEADWKRYGKAAGPIRNAQMLKEGRPDEVWAFHDNLSDSKGTADMVRKAKRAGIPIRLFSHKKATG